MPNFDAFSEPEKITVELITLSDIPTKLEVADGMTVGEFKRINGLTGTKLINEESEVLRDSDVLNDGEQLYVATPKKNG